jgi:hypothetical protein
MTMLVPGIRLVRVFEMVRGQVQAPPRQEKPMGWRKYSATTTAEKQCRDCHSRTILPGKRGWWWRWQPPKDHTRLAGRTTESLCAACYATEATATA